jgi:soluble lytic murein transglycosylase-like protein
MEEIQNRYTPHVERKLQNKSRFSEDLDRALDEGKSVPEAARKRNVRLPGATAAGKGNWDAHVAKYSERYGLDEALIRAVIQVESAGNPKARSRKGAMGLMQLMPKTAAMLGVSDAYDPEQNIRGGIKYLSQLSDKYDGDLVKVLAAYNAGPARVDSFGGVPPYKETQNYVDRVLALYDDSEGE